MRQPERAPHERQPVLRHPRQDRLAQQPQHYLWPCGEACSLPCLQRLQENASDEDALGHVQVGDTIYNLLRFNELPVRQALPPLSWAGLVGSNSLSVLCCPARQGDDNDRPLDPPVIREAEVVWNPFEDIVPRVDKEAVKAEAEAMR
jgi:hypothetical protein